MSSKPKILPRTVTAGALGASLLMFASSASVATPITGPIQIYIYDAVKAAEASAPPGDTVAERDAYIAKAIKEATVHLIDKYHYGGKSDSALLDEIIHTATLAGASRYQEGRGLGEAATELGGAIGSDTLADIDSLDGHGNPYLQKWFDKFCLAPTCS